MHLKPLRKYSPKCIIFVAEGPLKEVIGSWMWLNLYFVLKSKTSQKINYGIRSWGSYSLNIEYKQDKVHGL